jgi:hypothetical protein
MARQGSSRLLLLPEYKPRQRRPASISEGVDLEEFERKKRSNTENGRACAPRILNTAVGIAVQERRLLKPSESHSTTQEGLETSREIQLAGGTHLAGSTAGVLEAFAV